MTPLRFLAAFTAAAATAAIAIAGVNAAIDPLGVVPGSPSVSGVNARKVLRFNNDRIHKPLDLRAARPRTVVLGTSRILQAFDPDRLAGTPYAPAYNYGLAGGNLDELEGHFEKFIAPTPSVEHVFVELFFPRVVAHAERPVASRPELLASTVFSWSALEQSVETVWQNRRLVAGAPAPGPVVLADGRQSFVELSTVPNFLGYPASVARKPVRDDVRPTVLASLRRMQQVARRRGIDLTFFVSPMHAVQLYGLFLDGRWPALEALKRTVAGELRVLDFSAYTPVVEEPVQAEMRYWSDPHHFSALTAGMLADRFAGRSVPVEGFGVPLAADRLDRDLQAWAAARDRWIARNPGWQQLFRRAHAGGDTGLPAVDDVPGGQACPLRVGSDLLAGLTPSSPSRTWVVASSRTTLDPPLTVDVRPAPGPEEACELTVRAAPEAPGARPVDWRMGHSLGSPWEVRGRTVRYTVEARASAPTTLSAGSIYVYDGVRTTATPLPAVTPAWRTVAVEHTVSARASTLEVWLRLVDGRGSVRPLGTRIDVRATVDLAHDAR